MNANANRFGIGERERDGRGGFTFVELIVVIVILTIVAGLLLPRLTSWKSRQGEQSVRAVADVLTAAAKRDTYSTQRCSVEFDAKTGRFRLFVLRVADVHSFDPGAESWMEDPLTPTAILDQATLVAVSSGIAELDPKKFQIEFPGAGGTQGRPGLAMQFTDDAGQAWVVRLPSTATRAEVISAGSAADRAAGRELFTGDTAAIDLDATGRRDDPW